MRIIKIVCMMFCVMSLTGCMAKNKEASDWIPEETTQLKEDKSEEKSSVQNSQKETVSTAETKASEPLKYTLTDVIVSENSYLWYLNEFQQTTEQTPITETDNGEFHRNTFYIDGNGLLCISENIKFEPDKNQCVLKKQYCLTDKSVFTETQTFGMEGKWKKENNKLYVDISLLAELFSWMYQVEENNQIVISDDRITVEKFSSQVYEPIVARVTAGKCWSLAGTMIDSVFLGEEYANTFTCTGEEDYIEVTPGEQLRFNYYCCWLPDVASILFLDSRDKVIQVYAYTKSNTFQNYILTVPANATKMHLSFYNNQKYSIDRVRYVEGEDLSNLDSKWYEEECQKKLEEHQKLSWEKTEGTSLDKAYVTFVLDDCRGDMDKVADLFEEYNVPLCIGAIYQHFYNSAEGGEESILEVCERVVEHGGEVLAHNEKQLTENMLNSFETKYEHFYKDKKYLEVYGFDVQGIILAGGIGQVVGSEKSDMWVRMNFKYSDLYGVEAQGEPYYHRRMGLNNCREQYQEIIQEAIQKKQWVSFYFHDFHEVEEEKVREVLEYVSQISKDKLELANYKTVYEAQYETK